MSNNINGATAPSDSDADFDIASDRLIGAKAIAEFRQESVRRVNYLLETGRIPAGKEGRIWLASKRALRADYLRKTGASGI